VTVPEPRPAGAFEEFRRSVSAAALGSLGLRLCSILLLFVSQILLTRALGVAGFGAFAFALACVKGLAIAATFGAERLIVRDVSAYEVRRDWAALRSFLRWLYGSLLASATGAALAAASIAWLAAPDALWLPVLWIALALLPLTALLRIAQHVLAGLQRPLLAQLPETIVQPLLFLCAAAALALAGRLSAEGAMALQVFAAALAAVLGLQLLRHTLPGAAANEAPSQATGRWGSAFSMFVATGSMTLLAAAPVLLLGIMSGPEEAGVMAVARSLADLMLVPLLAFGSVMGPLLGRLWAEGDREGVQRCFTAFARGSAIAVAPIAIGLFLLREPLLSLFGEPFGAGAEALSILLVGQLAGSLAGSNVLLLSTLGHERVVALISAASLVAGTAATALLIPAFGVTGAAAGAATASIIWNAALVAATRRLTGLSPGAFARLR
jgi:O-antigen/teichoic acid export membrane protein